MSYCFGRKPHQPERLEAAPKHKFGAALVPPILDRHDINFTPELYKNNIIGDCTAVSLANAARSVAALNGYELNVDPDDVPKFYAFVVGCEPTIAAMLRTEGAELIDVLHKQETHGFNIGVESLVANWGVINHTSRDELALGMNHFGAIYLGFTIRERDMQNIGKLWTLQEGRNDGRIVGGHCVIAWDYTGLGDNDTVRIGTWGRWQLATWSWVNNRLDEAYGLVWRQLVQAQGTYWNGLTPDEMVARIG